MEEAAKTHAVVCAISGDVAKALSGSTSRLHRIGFEMVKGISTEIPIFAYEEIEAAATPLRRRRLARDRGRAPSARAL